MSHYLRIVANIVFLFLSFGILLPWMISMPDTMLVVAGILYILLVVPSVLYYFNRAYVTSLFNKIKGN